MTYLLWPDFIDRVNFTIPALSVRHPVVLLQLRFDSFTECKPSGRSWRFEDSIQNATNFFPAHRFVLLLEFVEQSRQNKDAIRNNARWIARDTVSVSAFLHTQCPPPAGSGGRIATAPSSTDEDAGGRSRIKDVAVALGLISVAGLAAYLGYRLVVRTSDSTE